MVDPGGRKAADARNWLSTILPCWHRITGPRPRSPRSSNVAKRSPYFASGPLQDQNTAGDLDTGKSQFDGLTDMVIARKGRGSLICSREQPSATLRKRCLLQLLSPFVSITSSQKQARDKLRHHNRLALHLSSHVWCSGFTECRDLRHSSLGLRSLLRGLWPVACGAASIRAPCSSLCLRSTFLLQAAKRYDISIARFL